MNQPPLFTLLNERKAAWTRAEWAVYHEGVRDGRRIMAEVMAELRKEVQSA